MSEVSFAEFWAEHVRQEELSWERVASLAFWCEHCGGSHALEEHRLCRAGVSRYAIAPDTTDHA